METVRVEPPPAALRPLVVCLIRREAGAGGAAVVQANPYACINVVERGAVQAEGFGALPDCFVTGPLTRPLATQASGPLLSFSLVVQPWLLPALLGRPPAPLVDRIEAWPQARSVLSWTALQQALPARAWEVPGRIALGELVRRGPAAAAAALGLGERQYRRRCIEHLGLAPKAWARLQRVEAALVGMDAASALADLAQDAGFADQAHMSREFRAVLDHSPAALRRGLAARWSLAPARAVRNLQDADEGAS